MKKKHFKPAGQKKPVPFNHGRALEATTKALSRSDKLLKESASIMKKAKEDMSITERKLRTLGYGTYLGAATYNNVDNILRMAILKPDYDKALILVLDFFKETTFICKYIKDKYVVKYVTDELASRRTWSREQRQLVMMVREDTGVTHEKKSSFSYMNDVGYTLQWKDVLFYNRYFTIYAPHDGKTKFEPYIVHDKLSSSSLNYIKEYLQDRMPRVYGSVNKGKLYLEGEIDLSEAIRMLESPTYSKIVKQKISMLSLHRTIFNDIYVMSYNESMSKAKMLSKADFEKYKSKFINFLLERQLEQYRIIPCNEEFVHTNSQGETENAFIFTLKSKYAYDDVILVVENLNPDRATLLFRIAKSRYEESLKTIHAFLRSDEINKRSNLRMNSKLVQSLKALSFNAVNHRDDYPYTWKYVMESKLRTM